MNQQTSTRCRGRVKPCAEYQTDRQSQCKNGTADAGPRHTTGKCPGADRGVGRGRRPPGPGRARPGPGTPWSGRQAPLGPPWEALRSPRPSGDVAPPAEDIAAPGQQLSPEKHGDYPTRRQACCTHTGTARVSSGVIDPPRETWPTSRAPSCQPAAHPAAEPGRAWGGLGGLSLPLPLRCSRGGVRSADPAPLPGRGWEQRAAVTEPAPAGVSWPLGSGRRPSPEVTAGVLASCPGPADPGRHSSMERVIRSLHILTSHLRLREHSEPAGGRLGRLWRLSARPPEGPAVHAATHPAGLSPDLGLPTCSAGYSKLLAPHRLLRTKERQTPDSAWGGHGAEAPV